MRIEVIAVGTELLLGDVVDTNSTWISGRLAGRGIDCLYQSKVGDNIERIASVLRTALSRNDGVILCGGLGPTQDDITREALALVINAKLVLDEDLSSEIEEKFKARGREMPINNLRQAQLPEGSTAIQQTFGTAPGIKCRVGNKVVYAVPGVPAEMRQMIDTYVIADLLETFPSGGIIQSRTLRTWGASESKIAQMLGETIDGLNTDPNGVTVAFLASGIDGIKVRLTVRAPDQAHASVVLDQYEQMLRKILGELVFGVDECSMEDAVGGLLVEKALDISTAESLTGGLVSARLARIPGASSWLRGAVVAYDASVKRTLLGVDAGPVITSDAAIQMAEGVRKLLGTAIGLSLTGVAGPEPSEDLAVGTVIIGLSISGHSSEAIEVNLPGDRTAVQELAVISALDLLRRRLSAQN